MASGILISIGAGGGASGPIRVVAGVAFDPSNSDYVVATVNIGSGNDYQTPLDSSNARVQVPAGKSYILLGVEAQISNTATNLDGVVGYGDTASTGATAPTNPVIEGNGNLTTNYSFQSINATNIDAGKMSKNFNFEIPAGKFPFIKTFNDSGAYTLVFRVVDA